ncbi:Uric acid degradation bifunctional protein PucL [Posidoniimonas polymericola]|uniref:2-oxo-4-hydroxy-4-carboxy-5-ureidoimidazoline decarboxylase n=1 Tax=Posidoniimonas polymericola TaxID=2528002 RepID=A0A5C5YMH7_9BACT|nr:2-oxo-4-hydroxy-4-carboxy-5-ureidoimidazoline decarboxylase [Posidoniimonas polymericola]TWT76112.1 Uric acid degradation bifunctional protein PucL [Posidoniimonas polymericola]
MTSAVIAWLNSLTDKQAQATFKACCGSTYWARKMSAARPFPDVTAAEHAARLAFNAMPNSAWIEAFESHPRIGDIDSLRMKYAGNQQWSASEQAGAGGADEETIKRLAEGNDDYHSTFGATFIVCATGKSAAEMLEILEERLQNAPADEFEVACGEQRKITALRLDKLTPPDQQPKPEPPT